MAIYRKTNSWVKSKAERTGDWHHMYETSLRAITYVKHMVNMGQYC